MAITFLSLLFQFLLALWVLDGVCLNGEPKVTSGCYSLMHEGSG